MQLFMDHIHVHQSPTAHGVSVDGNICVLSGNRFFPEENWFDLVLTDLIQWLPALISFKDGHSDSCLLPFMDGPAEIRLRRSDKLVSAEFIWNHHTEYQKEEIDFQGFVNSVVKAARQLCRELHVNHVCSDMIMQINFWVKKLST